MNYHMASLLLGYSLGLMASIGVQVLISRGRRKARQRRARGVDNPSSSRSD